MKLLKYNELLAEIEDTKALIKRLKNPKAKRDRRKYLDRLLRDKIIYEKYKGQAQS